MAFKQVDTNNVATKKIWLEKVYRDTNKASFLAPLMGTAGTSVVVKHTEFGKQKGDRIRINNLTAIDPKKVVTGGLTQLRPIAQSLSNYSCDVTLEQYDLPVGSKTKKSIDKQRAVFEIDDESEKQLVEAGSSVIDDMLFTALYSSPTRIVYAGDATSTATLETSDKITPERLTFMETIARGGDRDANDARVYEPLQPIKVDGQEYLLFMCDWNTHYDLKRNSEYLQAMREAEVRGASNPIFKWANAVWGNIIVKAADRVPTYLTGGAGSDVPYAKCMLLGANALAYADAGAPSIDQDIDNIDKIIYYNWTAIMGATKVQFNSKDRGVIQFICARTKVLDRAL